MVCRDRGLEASKLPQLPPLLSCMFISKLCGRCARCAVQRDLAPKLAVLREQCQKFALSWDRAETLVMLIEDATVPQIVDTLQKYSDSFEAVRLHSLQTCISYLCTFGVLFCGDIGRCVRQRASCGHSRFGHPAALKILRCPTQRPQGDLMFVMHALHRCVSCTPLVATVCRPRGSLCCGTALLRSAPAGLVAAMPAGACRLRITC